jgi:hypothetical protein
MQAVSIILSEKKIIVKPIGSRRIKSAQPDVRIPNFNAKARKRKDFSG